jgi:hypothetical protein
MKRRHSVGLFERYAESVTGRKLGLPGRLVDIGGNDRIGFDPDLPQQIKPARRGRRQHEPRGGCRTARVPCNVA